MTTLTRDEFLEALDVRKRTLRPVSVKSVEVIPPPNHSERRKLRFNDDIVADGSAFDELCSKLFQVPASFLRKAPIDLSNTIVKRMFKETETETKRQLIVRGKEVVSSKLTDTPYQAALPVFERVFKELPGVKSVNFRDWDTYFDVDLVSEKLELKPKVNDITRGGVQCRYSEFMLKSPSIVPFTERLTCLNGMTFPEFYDTYAFDDVHSFLENIGSAVKAAKETLETKIEDQLKKAVELKINGEQAIRRIFKQNRIPIRLLDGALAAHVIEGDGSAYGVLQAITRAANSDKVSDHNRSRLQALGGAELAVVSASHCPECYSEL